MSTCKTCRHWLKEEEERRFAYYAPVDPDGGPKDLPFGVRACGHPSLTFCERPVEINGFGVADGSEYEATLYTAEEFGCVRHEPCSV